MTPFLSKLKESWQRLSILDLIALLLAAFGAFAAIAGFQGKLYGFAKFLAACCVVYLFFRLISWGRTRLLWSLRNRLIVAYVFIAVVPILLILILVLLAGRIVYSQLGAYLLYEDIHDRVEMIRDISEHIAAAHSAPMPAGLTEQESEEVLAAQSKTVHDRELPGLDITFSNDTALLRNVSGPAGNAFAGILQQENSLSLISIRAIPPEATVPSRRNRKRGPKGLRVVTLRVPIKPEFLASIAPDLGAIQLNLMDPYLPAAGKGVVYSSGTSQYVLAKPIVAQARGLQRPLFWLDASVEVVSRLDAAYLGRDGRVESPWPVLAVFNARLSHLNSRIFTSLGELRGTYLLVFVGLGILFLLIEIAALITGIVLTTRITTAVSDLYNATQFVRARDFSHRVHVQHRDQLGVLGDSFNEMTGSITNLIEEQKQRQRLEGELTIAREVQNQLFPQQVPHVPGVEIEAICKAARTVSGDYYDFIQLSPTHIAIAVADISGKGISAALLMASLQAALRSQVLAPGTEHLSTAELVARLNNHLVRNTGDDRFATFFIAVYDSATRTLRYTNAGHLPSFLICHGKSVRLDKGGMVLGVVEDYEYEEGKLSVPPGAILVGYSDGLVEPENVYGEEFGIRRVEDAAIRVEASDPRIVAESLMAAAEEWAGTPEQADDMTVIVARLR
jgi:sigma-B regulation protein RsbU (phosphoserine phosphatase)